MNMDLISAPAWRADREILRSVELISLPLWRGCQTNTLDKPTGMAQRRWTMILIVEPGMLIELRAGTFGKDALTSSAKFCPTVAASSMALFTEDIEHRWQ